MTFTGVMFFFCGFLDLLPSKSFIFGSFFLLIQNLKIQLSQKEMGPPFL